MKKILLALLIIFFAGNIVFADNGRPKHKNPARTAKKANVKKHCPNRPGCICH